MWSRLIAATFDLAAASWSVFQVSRVIPYLPGSHGGALAWRLGILAFHLLAAIGFAPLAVGVVRSRRWTPTPQVVAAAIVVILGVGFVQLPVEPAWARFAVGVAAALWGILVVVLALAERNRGRRSGPQTAAE